MQAQQIDHLFHLFTKFDCNCSKNLTQHTSTTARIIETHNTKVRKQEIKLGKGNKMGETT